MADFYINFEPECAECGCKVKFEHNEDFTFIKCINCGKEYSGGRDELIKINEDKLKAQLITEHGKELKKTLLSKMNKAIKRK